MIDYKSQYKVGGCIPQPKDKRDWKLDKLIPLSAVELPREYCSKIPYKWIYDQGRSSECCACAYSMIRIMQELEQSHIDEPFAPSFTYANRDEGEDYEGMMPRKCCSRGKYGSVLWSSLPNFYSYRKAKEIFNNNKIELLNQAQPFRINSFYTVSSDEEIKTAIYLTKGVLIGLNVTESFYYPQNGIIKYTEQDYQVTECNGHALVICGWKYIDNKPYWIIVNSWGKQWGKNGCCYIAFSDLHHFLMEEVYVLVDEINEMQIKQYREQYFKTNKVLKVKYEIKNLWDLLYRKFIKS